MRKILLPSKIHRKWQENPKPTCAFFCILVCCNLMAILIGHIKNWGCEKMIRQIVFNKSLAVQKVENDIMFIFTGVVNTLVIHFQNNALNVFGRSCH